MPSRIGVTLRPAKTPRIGMTLIEVMASVVIVSALIVGSLQALNLHLAQMEFSRAKSQAVLAANLLLEGWTEENLWIVPSRDSGEINGEGVGETEMRFRWTTEIVSHSDKIPELGVVRLSLFSLTDGHESKLPVVTVDVANYQSAGTVGVTP